MLPRAAARAHTLRGILRSFTKLSHKPGGEFRILQGETLCGMMQHDDQHNASLYDRDGAHSAAEKLFRDGGRALENADFDKPVKVFGLFNMDAGLAQYATMAYNVGSDYASKYLTPQTYNITLNAAKPHMSANAALKTAALTTTAMNVVLKSGAFFTPMINTMKESREERTQLARRIAPVLDEVAGKHSVGALNSVAKENTILKAHMVRMNKKYGVERTNNLIDLIGNAGPNLLLHYKQTKGMWAGNHPTQVDADILKAKQEQDAKNAEHQGTAGGELKDMGKLFVQGGAGAFTDRFKKSNLHKLQKNQRPYSALEMILTLQEQFEGNPKSHSYAVPGKRGESYPLEEYIARVAIHHFAEMADIDPEFSEIREALHEELKQSVKPIADAMRKGEFDAIGLVRLIGEGKLIQKGGRVVASPEDISEMLGVHSASHGAHHQSVEDHYAKATYNRSEFKKAIHSLEGDAQRIFAMMFSDEVLEDAGFKPAQIKQWRDETATKRDADKHLAAGALGVANDTQDAQHEGLTSKKEMALLQNGARKIAQDGVEAVHALRGSAINPHGIEQAVANVAVAKVLGDKEYFGKMIDKGQQELAATNDNGREANDNERSFAEREMLRAYAHGEREV